MGNWGYNDPSEWSWVTWGYNDPYKWSYGPILVTGRGPLPTLYGTCFELGT